MIHPNACLKGSIVILIFVLTQSAVWAFQNEPPDFRGIGWGADISNLEGLAKVHTQNSLDYYTRKNEVMTIGEAELKSVVYVFYKKRFCGSVLNFQSFVDSEKMKEALFDLYGEGVKKTEQYRWDGKDVTITYKYDKTSKKGKVSFFYMPIFNKKTRDDKRRGS